MKLSASVKNTLIIKNCILKTTELLFWPCFVFLYSSQCVAHFMLFNFMQIMTVIANDSHCLHRPTNVYTYMHAHPHIYTISLVDALEYV